MSEAVITPQPAPVRDLCWRGESELAALADRLGAALAGWADAWGIRVAALACRNAWEERGPGASAPRHWRAIGMGSDGTPLLHLGQEAATSADALATLMFGTAPAPRSSPNVQPPTLARTLAADAAVALEETLASALDVRAIAADRPHHDAPPAAARAWSGAVGVALQLGVAGRTLRLEVRVAASLAPASRSRGPGTAGPSRGQLEPLREVLGERRIPLQAMLSATPMTLRHLLDLAPGDVIVTSHPLTAPLHVLAASPGPRADAAPLYAGRLSQADGQVALTLAPVAELHSRSPS